MSDQINVAHPDGGHTLARELATLFRARPGDWLDGRTLGHIGGAYAWRTRVSELRRPPFNMTIENRQRREVSRLGTRFTVSEYRWLPEGLTREENAGADAPTSAPARL